MRTWLLRVFQWQYFWLAIIVAATLGLHFASAVTNPNLVFDEQYYVVEARGIMAGWGPLHVEQPPLGKLFIISGMRLFGDNPLGWRFFPILFGAASIVLFYFICSSLKMPRKAQIFATILLAFENLTFLQSGIAMLDVFSVTLMLGAFLLYLKGKQLAGGLSLGLSGLAKFIGALGGLVIFLHWVFLRLFPESSPLKRGEDSPHTTLQPEASLSVSSQPEPNPPLPPFEGEGKGTGEGSLLSPRGKGEAAPSPFGGRIQDGGVSRRRLLPLLILAVTAILSFLVLYPVLNYAVAHTLVSPFTLIRQAFDRTTSITFASGFSSSAVRPLSWLLDLQTSFYSNDPQYIAVVTPTIWVLIIPSMLYMLYKAVKGSEAGLFGLAWFAGTYLIWIPVVLITDRMTYLYYIYPAIGSVCIGIGLGMNDLLEMGRAEKGKVWGRLAPVVTYGYLALDLVLFVVLSPVFWPLVKWFPIQ